MPDSDDLQTDTTRSAAGPQRIPPSAPPARTGGLRRGRGRGRIVATALAVVGVLAAAGVAGWTLARDGVGGSTESQVRDAVETFVDALASGDLPALQASTCGALAEFYRDVPAAEFETVHRDAVAQGTVPVVTRFETVQVTGDAAIAQVIAHTRAEPSDASPRTFDLQRVDGTWKVCDPD